MSKQLVAAACIILWCVTVLVWGVVGAGCGVLIALGVGGEIDTMAPLGMMGWLLGMLGGAIAFKRKVAGLTPQALYDMSATGTLADCRWVQKKNGKWVFRWIWQAPSIGNFARKKERRL